MGLPRGNVESSALLNLTALTSLSIFHEVPGRWADLARLPQLARLALTAERLALPMEPLTALTSLIIDGVHRSGILSQLQAALLNMPRLRELELKCVPLATLPADLSTLTALTRLLVHTWQPAITAGWEHLRALSYLEALKLRNCLGGVELPAALTCLTALTCCNIVSVAAGQPTGGWQHLAALRRLLHLRCVALQPVPGELWGLTLLTRLELERCNTGNGDGLARLERLQSLSLIRCGLASIPLAVAALSELTCLNLAFNYVLASGWEHLLHLPLLELDLTWLPGACTSLGCMLRWRWGCSAASN